MMATADMIRQRGILENRIREERKEGQNLREENKELKRENVELKRENEELKREKEELKREKEVLKGEIQKKEDEVVTLKKNEVMMKISFQRILLSEYECKQKNQKNVSIDNTKEVLKETMTRLYGKRRGMPMRNKEMLELMLENWRSKKWLQGELFGENVVGLKEMVLEEINKRMKEYESSEENYLRSYLMLLLSSDDSKEEYQKTRNRSFRRYNSEKKDFEMNLTKEGIKIPSFGTYKKAIGCINGLIERQIVGVIQTVRIPDSSAGYRIPENVIRDFLKCVEVQLTLLLPPLFSSLNPLSLSHFTFPFTFPYPINF